MIDSQNIQTLAGKKLNLDTHYSLLDSGDVIYLNNGDLIGNEGNNNNFFVQNQLSNELCYEFPEDYVLKGRIKLNGSDQALFFNTPTYDEIGVLNTNDCLYSVCTTGTCLNFDDGFIRGVYKFNNAENDRRIYFIDGYNSNKYLDIDKPFPQQRVGSTCDECEITYNGLLDCEALNMVKNFKPPCISLDQTESGLLTSGVYQVGIGYSIDELVLTDYYFSPAFKAYSEKPNIGFTIEVDCEDSPFDEISIILVTNTRENSLVTYHIGYFLLNTKRLTISDVNNATILSTTQATQKRTVFDKSQHIATNGEVLLLGKHLPIEPLNYQPQANNIEVEWLEIKVPKKDAHKYPAFMRDEVYAIGLEWIGKKGNLRGRSHVPGREPTEQDLSGVNPAYIYEEENCEKLQLLHWQVFNTASVTEDLGTSCNDCNGEKISKRGQCGYWESQDFKYPNDEDTWGELACQPIRHHRMPENALTHIHDDFTFVQNPPNEDDCITQDTSGYCPSGINNIDEGDCINVLTIRLLNIEHPKLPDGSYDPDISGYRILVGDRRGNKTVLHKGLIFNVKKDTSVDGVEIFYPNYPFNDHGPDEFLLTKEEGYPDSIFPWDFNQDHYLKNFTYHSPDIHYRETKGEFGTEMKIYGEEVGWVEGKFDKVYQHPKTRLGIGDTQDEPYFDHATQVNSIAHYSKFNAPESLNTRREIITSQYLLPVNQFISNGKRFNNHLRESSYYIEIDDELLPFIDDSDNSRVIISNVIDSDNNDFTTALPIYYDYFNQKVYDDSGNRIQAVSYYVGIKIKQPNQYGGLEQIEYRPVTCATSVTFNVSDEEIFYDSDIVYGGDVYITKHSLLRKMPLFTEWLTDVPIETETNYREFRNVWYPRFWYDNLTEVNDQFNLDDRTIIGAIDQGRFYIFVTGVLDFWCESEFIGTFREQDSTINGQYYPKINYNDIARADKIPYDNKFLYNLTLLNNEIERVYQNLDLTDSDADFIVSYSLKNDFQSQNDKWLQFLPLNYTVLPRSHGRFSGMHYTDDYSILFAFENKILYSQLNYSLNTNEGSSILLTQGDIFSNRLRPLSNEETGYSGCVDPLSFVNTRYGTFFLDRYRKKLFLWNGKLEDVTGNMQSWMNNFLNHEYPDYTNSAICVFDNFTKNVYLTGNSAREKWTLSYKPEAQGFISFHSFIPSFYFTDNNTYLTSNDAGIWKHNIPFKYTSYYGTEATFEVGLIIGQFKNTELQSVELFAEFIKNTNLEYGANIYKKDKFFNKIFAYNNNGSTGYMTVVLKDKNNPNNSFLQNLENNPVISEVTHVGDSIYRFNKFENIRLNHDSQPLIRFSDNGMSYTPQSTSALVPPYQRETIRGKWIKLHLIMEDCDDHKILLQLVIPNTDDLKL